MRTFVVGDIHGAHRALKQCLERSEFDYDNDTLISLGDIADGWSEVPECVDELLKIKNLIAIKGNHDFWLLQWLEYGMATRGWREQGGNATIEGYIRAGKPTDRDHLKFFKYQHLYYIDDQNRAFVHGGFHTSLGKDDNNIYIWDRSLWEDVALVCKRAKISPHKLAQYKEIYIGHTSTENWGTDQPMKACNVYNMDTGAGYMGRLTFMDIDTKDYYQSDSVYKLYAGERGRM